MLYVEYWCKHKYKRLTLLDVDLLNQVMSSWAEQPCQLLEPYTGPLIGLTAHPVCSETPEPDLKLLLHLNGSQEKSVARDLTE